MKVIVALFAVIGVIVCLPLIVGMLGAGLGIVALAGFAFLWFLPILIIAFSDKTTAGEKAAWILAIIFLSWFAWIFYFLLAPIKEKPEYALREYRYR